MEIFYRPPQWLVDILPPAAKTVLGNGGWLVVVGLIGILLLAILWKLAASLFSGNRRQSRTSEHDLEIDLSEIPEALKLTGDRRLQIEGTPARLRFVIVAPAGKAHDINIAAVPTLLDKVLPGLSAIFEQDKPFINKWPMQMSYQGFANLFHRNTPLPEGEKEPSRWILVAGRAHVGSHQIMLGLGLQAVKPTTIGRRRVDMHDWPNLLRIRVRD